MHRRGHYPFVLTVAATLVVCLTMNGNAQVSQAQLGFAGPSASQPAAPTTIRPNSVDAAYDQLRENAQSFQLPFNHIKALVQLVRPSVVHIEALKSNGSGNRSVEEAGSGFIFEHKGKYYVLTNRHVIDDVDHTNVRLQLVDGRFFYPSKIWTDKGTDLAVMETVEPQLTPCRIGTSSAVEVGDFVVAIGSPFGLNHSASYGIVSAMGRRDLQLGSEGVRYQDFIQTDAAINPGNSGGPLLDLSGEVIGINSAIASNSGSNEGVGFAIPIDMAMKIATDLIDGGEVARAFLGVSLDAHYTPEVAAQLGLRTRYGARVAGVTPSSPAEQAQLVTGDVILRFGGTVIQNDSHLVQEVSMTPIGSTVSIEVFRQGQVSQFNAVVTDRSAFDPRR